MKIKLKGCHFDTVEVMEAEFQVMMNILIEQNFQGCIQETAEALVMVHTGGNRLLQGWW
jgi:hypothetical protein